MPLETQNGSVADRLRNFFKISGRIPSPMDENIVGVANLVDLDGPPWRTTDENWATSALIQNAVAAQFSYAGVYMPRLTRGVAVVKQVIITNDSAVVNAYAINFVRVLPTDQNLVIDVEHFGDSAAGLNPRVPLRGGIFTNAAVIGEELVRVLIPPNSSIIVPVSFALRGVSVDPNPHGIYVVCQTVNLSVRPQLHGTFYATAL